jgi:hypothetical protein
VLIKINNKISLYSPYLKTIKRQCIYSSTEDSEVILVSEHNNAGLKKLSSFVWTDKSLIWLSKCHVSLEVLNREQHLSYFAPDYLISGLTVTGLATVNCSFLCISSNVHPHRSKTKINNPLTTSGVHRDTKLWHVFSSFGDRACKTIMCSLYAKNARETKVVEWSLNKLPSSIHIISFL